MACILGYFLLPLNLLYSNSVFSGLRGSRFPHRRDGGGRLGGESNVAIAGVPAIRGYAAEDIYLGEFSPHAVPTVKQGRMIQLDGMPGPARDEVNLL